MNCSLEPLPSVHPNSLPPPKRASTMAPFRRSLVWQFFKFQSQQQRRTVCSLCSHVMSWDPQSNSTSNMLKHLRRKHPDQLTLAETTTPHHHPCHQNNNNNNSSSNNRSDSPQGRNWVLVGVQVQEDRSGSSEFSQHNSDDRPITASPEHFLSENNEQDESTSVAPTPTQQKPESYQLRHNNHLTIVLEALARDESFMDVTLTAQGRSLKAHKSVLSAVSSYFRGVLRDNPCQHPIIIMPRDVRFEELYSIVNYIYKGEMTVAAEDLTSLLKTAEILQVSGLAPSDSSATVNPQTESLPMGNVRSSSNSSSASSTNVPPVSRPTRPMKAPSQSLSTPPARPKSIDSMINPADLLDVDMTCVKEEVLSGGEDEKDEPHSKVIRTQVLDCSQIAECSQPQECPQDPLECSQTTDSEAKEDDNASDQVVLGFPSPYDHSFDQPMASTSSHEAEFRSMSVKSDPERDFNSQLPKPNDNPQPLQCPHCDEQYRDVESIDSHLRLKHPSKPSFTCKCGRIFTRQIHHQAHARMCSSS